MKFRVLFLTGLLMSAVPVFSQSTRTVTNADLEKYRSQRLKAERDYQENYARMGFPSPEELQKQIEKGRAEREALSARLTTERLRQEKDESDRNIAAAQFQPNIYIIPGPEGRGYYYADRYGNSRWYRPPFRYSPSIRAGNGIPITNYNFYTPIRQTPIRMGTP